MHVRSVFPFRSPQEPLSNYAIMTITACIFAAQVILDPGVRYLSILILDRWSMPGLLGHMWLHMTVLHLAGNLLFLWIFGYYVCPRLGGAKYLLAYVGTGLAAGLVHLLYDGRPVIGASGAIMGILGLYVVICFGQLSSLGPWLILTWFVATLAAGMFGHFPAAYMAHVGGFLSGMTLGFCLLLLRIVDSDRTDPALQAMLRPVPARAQAATLP